MRHGTSTLRRGVTPARVLALATALLAGILLAGCTSPARSSTSAAAADRVGVTSYPPARRPTVAPFHGTTLDGRAFSLSQYQGRVTVINVWASWCGPCRDESPMLAALARASSPSVGFVGIDETDDHPAAVRFVASVGARYPEVVDDEGALLARLRLLPTKGIPSTMVLDLHGRVAGTVVGPVSESALRQLIQAAGSA